MYTTLTIEEKSRICNVQNRINLCILYFRFSDNMNNDVLLNSINRSHVVASVLSWITSWKNPGRWMRNPPPFPRTKPHLLSVYYILCSPAASMYYTYFNFHVVEIITAFSFF